MAKHLIGAQIAVPAYRALAARAVSEKTLQADVRRLAGLCGWAEHVPYDSRNSPSGWPDLTFLRPPRIVFIELKTERGSLSVEQVAMLDLLRRYPWAEVYLFRPSDWLEGRIEEVLR